MTRSEYEAAMADAHAEASEAWENQDNSEFSKVHERFSAAHRIGEEVNWEVDRYPDNTLDGEFYVVVGVFSVALIALGALLTLGVLAIL